MIRAMIPLFALLLMGCGASENSKFENVRDALDGEYIPTSEESSPSGGETASGEDQPNARAIDRRIIYTAEVSIVVKDFENLEAELPKLVKESGGFIANANIDRTSGQNRYGSWQVRIPVEQYDHFLEAVDKLGIPERHNQSAQDVTEEYVDLEARIANKKKLEERILELLANSEGKIKDVIEVERELARVRSEVEQMEGRLRYLKNRIALTTVTVSAREQRDYTPPSAPTFLTRLTDSWSESLETLQDGLENLTIGLVFSIPWAIIYGVGFYIFYKIARWIWRRQIRNSNRDLKGR